jgi:hypothetical protein
VDELRNYFYEAVQRAIASAPQEARSTSVDELRDYFKVKCSCGIRRGAVMDDRRHLALFCPQCDYAAGDHGPPADFYTRVRDVPQGILSVPLAGPSPR